MSDFVCARTHEWEIMWEPSENPLAGPVGEEHTTHTDLHWVYRDLWNSEQASSLYTSQFPSKLSQ